MKVISGLQSLEQVMLKPVLALLGRIAADDSVRVLFASPEGKSGHNALLDALRFDTVRERILNRK